MPIIIVTGSVEEADIVRGLDSGANDYVLKPYRRSELLPRLQAQLRIWEDSVDAVHTIGPFSFRPSAKLLLEAGKRSRIRLTEKETAILKLLYRSGMQPVPRRVLLDKVWGSRATMHTLETHIYRLRTKIQPNPNDFRLLLTEPGGYRLSSVVADEAPAYAVVN
jgi:DNA-binding response OmpR family regulator